MLNILKLKEMDKKNRENVKLFLHLPYFITIIKQ